MKIIYLHQYFNTPDMVGGTRSYEMAKRMVMAGHQVEMVTTRTDGAINGSDWVVEEVDGIRVHWLPVNYSNAMGIARRLLAFTEFARRASAYASRLQGDVVFASSTPLTIAIPGVKASKNLKVPLVFEVRDLWPEIPIAMGALNFPFSAYLAKKLERWAYRHSDAVVTLSPGMTQGVIKTGVSERHVTCVPNSADIDLFDGAEERGRQFRSERPWLGQRPLVLYAGTFGRVNGVNYMVELANHMQAIDPEVRFLAVGAGAERETVESLAQEMGVLNENFFIEDPVSKKEVPTLFSAATVCTSWVINLRELWNNSANKVFDALAAGRPVAINHGGWQKDLIEEHDIGVALPALDTKAAARELAEFLGNDEQVLKAGEGARTLANSRFSRDQLAGKLIAVLENAVAKRDE
ncbi:glycosyltransferase family 4 protein [Marinobacter sp. SS21]|uniref:glycosyltransferase family 4 protein n=1 Tax=Marinobacter sp. SS21 TaxID=2979460 RepID=UPI00232FFA35|nr:glycosyltransferase family 4 protein [Marinobacter sp. SS21]MDC0664175.1 glycosyltransferase family 4 protein [Marinobacter sp. SS21]